MVKYVVISVYPPVRSPSKFKVCFRALRTNNLHENKHNNLAVMVNISF